MFKLLQLALFRITKPVGITVMIMATVGVVTKVQASGGEQRKRILNYCDTSEYDVRIEAFDFINNYERFTYFEFYSHVMGPTGDVSLGAPLSYFDDSIINDGNTVYFPKSLFNNNDDEKPRVVVTQRSDNQVLMRVNINDNGEALYITCQNGEVKLSEDVTPIVLDDDFAYRINDASCSGGIRVFGRSGRFYGEDFPLGGNIAVPEYEFPITIRKADDPTQVMFINQHANGGRHVWCLGDDWWTTADLTLSCINDCPRGNFDPSVSHEAIDTVRARVIDGEVNSRRCLHNDIGDGRVKGVPCDRFAVEQDISIECDQNNVRGCVLYNERSNQAITLADDGETIVWAARISVNLQQQWVTYRDENFVALESLQFPGKCLSYRTGSTQAIILIDCNPAVEIYNPQNYAFIADKAIVTSPIALIQTPQVRVFRNDGQFYVSSFNSDEVDDQFIQGTFFEQVGGLEFCMGNIELFNVNGEVIFASQLDSNVDNGCNYVFLTVEQKATLFSFRFRAFGAPTLFQTDTTSVLLVQDIDGNYLSFQEPSVNFIHLSDRGFHGKVVKARFCSETGGAFFFLGAAEISVSEKGCQFFSDDFIQNFDNFFAYRNSRRSF
eukprot:Pgem_evm1s18815